MTSVDLLAVGVWSIVLILINEYSDTDSQFTEAIRQYVGVDSLLHSELSKQLNVYSLQYFQIIAEFSQELSSSGTNASCCIYSSNFR